MDNEFQNKDMVAKKVKMLKVIVMILFAVIIIIVLGFVSWKQDWLNKVKSLFTRQPNYQALFLDNNLLYFGKVKNINSKYVTLSDIYYFASVDPKQPQQLVKFGTQEIHKPKDKMLVNRDHIVFIEDLESDSQVVQAITEFKKRQTK